MALTLTRRISLVSVNHGSTISLFHRLRSQTVSTRYLCVSGAPTWFKGSDGEPFLNSNANHHIPNQEEPSSCFVAKMSSWDPFIIYLVDPHIESSSVTGRNSGKAPPTPGYPPPPINVLPLPANGQGQPICYNQAVVLQCLNTAVVSPVMIIRKVDRSTVVVGGGQSSAFVGTPNVDPCAEAVGDPVSQLHKIAFEVLEDPKAHAPVAENRDVTLPGHSGHFLGCLNEDVGLRKPLSARQWVASSMSGPPTPTTPITPLNAPSSASSSKTATTHSDSLDSAKMMVDPMSTASIAAAQAAAHTRYSMNQRRADVVSSPLSAAMPRSHHLSTSQSQPGVLSSHLSSGDEEGGNIKRPRRVSSSVVIAQKDRGGSSAAKNRRRGQSLSMIGMQNQLNSTQQPAQYPPPSPHHSSVMQGSFPASSIASSSSEAKLHLRRTSSFANSLSNSETSSLGVPASAMWTVDVHDSDIWTIVGTDIARHTFYMPNKLVGGVKAALESADRGIAHLINVPAPAAPITPMPVVWHFASPGAPANGLMSRIGGSGSSSSSSSSMSSKLGSSSDYVTLVGDNLTSDLFVYFGDWRSTTVTTDNKTTLYCEPPPRYEEIGLPRGKVPITLVRRDGVIYPTSLIYHC